MFKWQKLPDFEGLAIFAKKVRGITVVRGRPASELALSKATVSKGPSAGWSRRLGAPAVQTAPRGGLALDRLPGQKLSERGGAPARRWARAGGERGADAIGDGRAGLVRLRRCR